MSEKKEEKEDSCGMGCKFSELEDGRLKGTATASGNQNQPNRVTRDCHTFAVCPFRLSTILACVLHSLLGPVFVRSSDTPSAYSR